MAAPRTWEEPQGAPAGFRPGRAWRLGKKPPRSGPAVRSSPRRSRIAAQVRQCGRHWHLRSNCRRKFALALDRSRCPRRRRAGRGRAAADCARCAPDDRSGTDRPPRDETTARHCGRGSHCEREIRRARYPPYPARRLDASALAARARLIGSRRIAARGASLGRRCALGAPRTSFMAVAAWATVAARIARAIAAHVPIAVTAAIPIAAAAVSIVPHFAMRGAVRVRGRRCGRRRGDARARAE